MKYIHRVFQEEFGITFLLLNYIDITKNTYIQSWTVIELVSRQEYVSLRFHLLDLFSVKRYPSTAQVRPWTDTEAKPSGGTYAM
jgi:hypothetical protein